MREIEDGAKPWCLVKTLHLSGISVVTDVVFEFVPPASALQGVVPMGAENAGATAACWQTTKLFQATDFGLKFLGGQISQHNNNLREAPTTTSPPN